MQAAAGLPFSALLIVCLSSFLVALSVALCLSYIGRWSKIGHDLHSGIQKFHTQSTSRLGGLAIIAGLGVGLYGTYRVDSELATWLGWLLLACIPVLVGGLVEDFTHEVSPRVRLLLSLVSASIAYFFLDIGVKRTDVGPVDALLALPTASYLVTLLVVAGFTNAVNIIDGFHGLAVGVVLIMLAGLLAMAWWAGDALVIHLCWVSLAATAGFFVMNWPRGQVFLGDAGAYLLGLWVVELGLLLIARNPGISPMAPVVVGILPLIETLFSMYRRKFVSHHPVNHPDGLHLHTLVYRRLLLNPACDRTDQQKNAANARVAIYFWLPTAMFTILACLFLSNTRVQLGLMLAFTAAYIWLYQRLVRFRFKRGRYPFKRGRYPFI